MKLSTWFTIHAICAFLFAGVLLYDPTALLATYGLTTDAVGVSTGRQLGATFLAFGVIAWGARRAQPGPALKAIVTGFAVALPVGFACALYAQLSISPGPAHWTAVGSWAFLAAGYVAFLVSGKTDRRASAVV